MKLTEKEAISLGLMPKKRKSSGSKPSARKKNIVINNDLLEPPGSLVFFIPCRPKPKERARKGNSNVFFTPNKTLVYEKTIRQIASLKMRGFNPFSCPLEINYKFVFNPPKMWSSRCFVVYS